MAFIEVTAVARDSQPCRAAINIDHIESVRPNEFTEGAVIFFSVGDKPRPLWVAETFDEVCQRIKKIGMWTG